MNVGFLIIARLKSKRLPNKLLKKIYGKLVIEHMIERVKKNRIINNVILCTSNLRSDDPLEKICKKKKIKIIRGDPNDVIKRMRDATKKFNLEYVISITADCPLVELSYVKKFLDIYRKTNADLLRAFDLPHGAFCYGISPKSLNKICEIKATKNTANWEMYFTETKIFKIYDVKIPKRQQNKMLRLTLDYVEDLKLINIIFEKLYKKKKFFNLDDILNLIRLEPYLLDLNKHRKIDYVRKYKRETNLALNSNYLKIKKKYSKYKKFVDFIK